MTAKSNQTARGTRPLSEKHHMQIPWYDVIVSEERQADHATLEERASLVGRVGIMLLACGTGAWRVREAMNTVARALRMSTAMFLMSILFIILAVTAPLMVKGQVCG